MWRSTRELCSESCPTRSRGTPVAKNHPHGPAVRLHIEHLVLDGFPAQGLDASRLHAALERELTRLLAQADSTAWTSRALDHLQAPVVQLATHADSAAWGRQIARALMRTVVPKPVEPPHAVTSSGGSNQFG